MIYCPLRGTGAGEGGRESMFYFSLSLVELFFKKKKKDLPLEDKMLNPNESWDPAVLCLTQLHFKNAGLNSQNDYIIEISFFSASLIEYQKIKFLNHENAYPNPVSSYTYFSSTLRLLETSHLPNPRNSF